MATVSQLQLVAPQQLTNADAGYYTSPVNTTTQIGRVAFCNTTGSAATITAGITTGGAIAAGTTLISARTVAPGETYVSPELAGMVVPAGSSIRAQSGTGSAITFTVSGISIQ